MVPPHGWNGNADIILSPASNEMKHDNENLVRNSGFKGRWS